MIIASSDKKRFVDLGSYSVWKSLYSTVRTYIDMDGSKYPSAMVFFESVSCQGNDGYKVGRQINHIRDELSQIPPEKSVYDLDNPGLKAPWEGKISPVITSCANLYTTADGKDLLYEIVSILVYAQIMNVSVSREDDL